MSIGLFVAVLLNLSYSCKNREINKKCIDLYEELGGADLDKDCFCEGVNDELEKASNVFYIFGSGDFEEFSKKMKLKGIEVKHLGSIDLCEQSRIEGINSVILSSRRLIDECP